MAAKTPQVLHQPLPRIQQGIHGQSQGLVLALNQHHGALRQRLGCGRANHQANLLRQPIAAQTLALINKLQIAVGLGLPLPHVGGQGLGDLRGGEGKFLSSRCHQKGGLHGQRGRKAQL